MTVNLTAYVKAATADVIIGCLKYNQQSISNNKSLKTSKELFYNTYNSNDYLHYAVEYDESLFIYEIKPFIDKIKGEEYSQTFFEREISIFNMEQFIKELCNVITIPYPEHLVLDFARFCEMFKYTIYRYEYVASSEEKAAAFIKTHISPKMYAEPITAGQAESFTFLDLECFADEKKFNETVKNLLEQGKTLAVSSFEQVADVAYTAFINGEVAWVFEYNGEWYKADNKSLADPEDLWSQVMDIALNLNAKALIAYIAELNKAIEFFSDVTILNAQHIKAEHIHQADLLDDWTSDWENGIQIANYGTMEQLYRTRAVNTNEFYANISFICDDENIFVIDNQTGDNTNIVIGERSYKHSANIEYELAIDFAYLIEQNTGYWVSVHNLQHVLYYLLKTHRETRALLINQKQDDSENMEQFLFLLNLVKHELDCERFYYDMVAEYEMLRPLFKRYENLFKVKYFELA